MSRHSILLDYFFQEPLFYQKKIKNSLLKEASAAASKTAQGTIIYCKERNARLSRKFSPTCAQHPSVLPTAFLWRIT
jgi:hypothetical protein